MQTALLHDLGKVAIPDAILNKPGPLDEAEWAFMKQHTIIGERIIAEAPALAAVAKLVRATHERHDGTGYPDGLAGDDDPAHRPHHLGVRRLRRHDRPRPHVPRRDRTSAIAELRRMAGRQFDPDTVEAVIGALHETSDAPPVITFVSTR